MLSNKLSLRDKHIIFTQLKTSKVHTRTLSKQLISSITILLALDPYWLIKYQIRKPRIFTFLLALILIIFSSHPPPHLKFPLLSVHCHLVKVRVMVAFALLLLKRLLHDYLSHPLAYVCNLSFSTGVFPDSLKIAKVIPIFKTDDPSSFSKYRPICILSCLSKILEKLVHSSSF